MSKNAPQHRPHLPPAPQAAASQAAPGGPQAGARPQGPLPQAPQAAVDPLEGAKRGVAPGVPEALGDGTLPGRQDEAPVLDTEPSDDEPDLPPVGEVARAEAPRLRSFRSTTDRVLAWQGRTVFVRKDDVLTEEKHGKMLMDQLERIPTFERISPK